MIELSKHGNLRAQVAARLFDAILAGELQPGERIFEAKLARQMRVSQGTVREALQDLEHRGLVIKYENRATFVSKLTAKQAEDRFALRLELEPMAAAEACQRLTSQDYAQLAKFLANMEKAWQQSEFVELVMNDLAFHQHIWKLSDNAVLERALNLVCAPLFAFHYLRFAHVRGTGGTPAYDFAQDHKEHRDLLAVLNTGKPEEAKRIFREMIQVWRVRIIKDVLEAEAEQVSARPGIEAVSLPND